MARAKQTVRTAAGKTARKSTVCSHFVVGHCPLCAAEKSDDDVIVVIEERTLEDRLEEGARHAIDLTTDMGLDADNRDLPPSTGCSDFVVGHCPLCVAENSDGGDGDDDDGDDDAEEFECENLCGFEGTFDECATHEQVCPKKAGKKRKATSAPDDDEDEDGIVVVEERTLEDRLEEGSRRAIDLTADIETRGNETDRPGGKSRQSHGRVGRVRKTARKSMGGGVPRKQHKRAPPTGSSNGVGRVKGRPESRWGGMPLASSVNVNQSAVFCEGAGHKPQVC
jgi:hypothetical protein